MDLKEVKQFLEQNKDNTEVKTFLDGFKVQPTLEVFKDKTINDKDFKAYLDSEKDKHHSKALETWKTNNLEKLINEEIRKRNPAKDEKDIALEELKRKVEEMEKEKTYERLKNVALKQATEKKLPSELVDYFIGADEETTIKNLETLEKVFTDKLENTVQERLKGSSYTPPDTKTDTNNTYESLLKNADNMSAQEVAEMFSKMGK